jgi:uncharacterized protein (DUF1684 family)
MRTILAFLLAGAALAGVSYHDLVERWRQEREAGLKADDGWLTLAGLFWLHPGGNTIGSAEGSAIRLPRGPARAGTIDYNNGRAIIRFDSGVNGTINGKRSGQAVLHSDAAEGKPDVVQLEDLTFFIIHRGTRDAIRLKDKRSEYRKAFTGLHWYPIRSEYRIEAKWVPYDSPHKLAVPNILGETAQEPSPGYAEFTLAGEHYRLYPVIEGSQLFFIFKDQTAGKETYPAGRFLHSEMPKNGQVLLDFNEAYNPPCAFTPFATCPLPPRPNRLSARIEAGELNYGHH